MVTQLAREFGAYVIGTGRAADRQKALDFGAQEFVDLENDILEDVGGVDLVFDVIGGDIQQQSAGLIVPNWVRSCSGRGTDDCGRTSATSQSSTTPSRPSSRPSDARERR
jgi:NADPH:quinone reductase-like Zn-dependent oxidoreductase